MRSKLSTYTTLMGLTLAILLTAPAFAVSSRTEIQLQNASASVKTISIQLRGTENDQGVLNTVKGMVNDILNRSELDVERIPVKKAPVAAVPVYENLEIVIGVTGSGGQGQPHRISITLQEVGDEGEPQFFDYSPSDPEPFRQTLQAYLINRLNLRIVEEKQ